MDAIIILTAKFLGWVVLVALCAFALLACASYLHRLYRVSIGAPLMRDAVREYRKTHPERFRHFDATKLED